MIIEDALTDNAEDEASLLADTKDRNLFAARVDPRTKARVGQSMRLTVEPSRLYFFSPSTGESLLNGASARSGS